MNCDELKQELFSVILNEKRNKGILIEVYIDSPRFVKKMGKEGKVAKEVIDFLDDNIQHLVDIQNQVSIQFFRNLKYEELIEIYCAKKADKKTECVDVFFQKKIMESSGDGEKEAEAITNYSDVTEAKTKEQLILKWSAKPKSFVKELIELTEAGNIVWNKSRLEMFYVVVDSQKEIKINRSEHKGKFRYYLTREKKQQISKKSYEKLYKAIKGEKYITDSSSGTKKNTSKKTEVTNTTKTKIMRVNDIYECLVPISASSKKHQYENLEKRKLKVNHIRETDKEYGYLIKRTDNGKLKWNLVKKTRLKGNVYTAFDNDKKLLLHCYSTENAFLYRFYKNGVSMNIGGIQQYLEKIILAKNPAIVYDAELIGYYPVNERKNALKNEKESNIKSLKTKRQVKVGFKDFVVRRNIFKCMHSEHYIEDIDAIVKIMNKNVEIEEVTVAAGYCKQCNLFFIMESTYQFLQRKGVVVFRAIDEKNYLNKNYLNGKLLAQESILMQFGYSVSQTEGISEERRHKILSVLVDNHILTKSEIISYLDFFINQRKNDKFAMAVAKWTIDRDYIRNYKIGEYSRIGVVYRND